MKQSALLLLLYSSVASHAQCSFFSIDTEQSKQFKTEYYTQYSSLSFYPESLETVSNNLNLFSLYGNYSTLNDPEDNQTPKPPVLTSLSSNLEVCEGVSTTLTAVSEYPIEWYTNYPPEGEPVGRGATFVTPPLTKGYYIYHAVANNNGAKSNSSDMEVVMVYPLPFINIVYSSASICAGESATLSAFGTRFYSWNTGETSNEIVIQPNQTTKYQVTGINTAGCRSSQEFTQVVENCKLDFQSTFATDQGVIKELHPAQNGVSSSVFPNPNTGEFQIKISTVTAFSRIELYNSYGELIFQTKASEELTTVNLSTASKGIYTLRILEQNTLIQQEKVVIEK